MFGKVIDFNSPIIRFLCNIFDLAVLNIFCSVLSIPILTIGAAITATYSVCFQIAQDNATQIVKPFWKSFRTNLKQAICIWLIMLIVIALLGIDLLYFMFSQSFVTGILQIAVCGVLFLLLAVATQVAIYAFALLSLFENTVKETLHNALYFATHNPIRSILALIIDVIMLALSIYAPTSNSSLLAIAMVLFGISLSVLLNCYILLPVFKPYMPNAELSE